MSEMTEVPVIGQWMRFLGTGTSHSALPDLLQSESNPIFSFRNVIDSGLSLHVYRVTKLSLRA